MFDYIKKLLYNYIYIIKGLKIMTGKGHLSTGFALSFATYTFTKDVGAVAWLATIFSIFGSTAPDWLEVRSGESTLIKHRTITHWLPLWVGLFLLSVFSISPNYFGIFDFLTFLDNYAFFNEYVASAMLGFSIGGILHLLFDLPNPMGIPILTPVHRFSLHLWNSGKMEIPIVIFVLLVSLHYAFDFTTIAQKIN